jgi:hypothetical protein
MTPDAALPGTIAADDYEHTHQSLRAEPVGIGSARRAVSRARGRLRGPSALRAGGQVRRHDDYGDRLTVSSREEIVKFVYPPGEFGYAEPDWREFDDLYIAPCVSLPDEAA